MTERVDGNTQPAGTATQPPGDERPASFEFMDRIADGVFLVGATGKFIDVNQAACESLGYRREELLSLSVANIAEDAESRLAVAFEGVEQGETVIVDATHVRKDGTTFPVQLNINALAHDGDRCLLAVARD
ncbi:MAG: PAS domain-containing protein, partial [Chloroflexi bacterium]|nr:PAS domain-containing protein [Chloroflexota bacterium]